MLPREVRVTQLDAFRIWQETEDLGMDWLLPRILGKQEETPEMAAGTALHQALETIEIPGEVNTVFSGEYRFDFNCACEVVLPTIRESEFAKQYGDVYVTGHVDGLIGNMVVDYKTTGQFDWDRYMESYQWRFYLDMSGCDQFLYQVFVIKPFGPEKCFSIVDTHQIKQFRYPELHQDCEQLVRAYRQVVIEHQELMAR
jgi:hypothetical protein